MGAKGADPGELAGKLPGGEIDRIERILHPRPRTRIAICASDWCGSHFLQRSARELYCPTCVEWKARLRFLAMLVETRGEAPK